MNKYDLVRYTRGTGLQIGGGEKFFGHFIRCEPGQMKLFARGALHYVVFPDRDPEDETRTKTAEAWRIIRDGGHLCVAGPHDEPPGGWDRLEKADELTVYRKRTDRDRAETWKSDKGKTCAVIRYGGFGDMIQTSSVLPGLKRQGYHITLFTHPEGEEVMRHDPHVDEIVTQDRNQVPNAELGPFWKRLGEKFDRVINFSESVEGSFLAMPGRMPYLWPWEARHAYMNRNYLEFIHLLAGAPLPPKQKFYTTSAEREWAERERRRLGGRVVVWALSGSSVHKVWPYLDMIIARLMLTEPDVSVVTVGGPADQALETGWEKEPRVIRRCGVWSIRETLAFAETADMVIGPETGLLNSVGLSEVAKIITLSHSSDENLTKHWKNCQYLTPEHCRCYPCHMMHFGFDACRRDEKTGVAECQAQIGPDVMWVAIQTAFRERKAA